jgi:hypothetical protein
MVLSYLLCGLLVLATFFVWVTIHEYSHLFMLKKLVGVRQYSMKLYPHRENGKFYWGYIYYVADAPVEGKNQFFVSMAPRVPGAVALVAFPFLYNHAPLWLAILAAGGVVDWVNGFIGYSPHSDLQKACAAGKVAPWVLRVVGYLLAYASVANAFWP